MNNSIEVLDNNLPGVYGIINNIDGRLYVGSAVNVRKRFNTHKHLLRNNKRSGSSLQNAWNFFGENNFKLIVLEYTKEFLLREKEQKWMDLTQSYDPYFGYNISKKANKIPYNIIIDNEGKIKWRFASEDTKRKIGEKNKGKVNFFKGKKRENSAKAIYQYDRNNILIKEWYSIAEASTSLNINNSNIARCCKDKRNSAGGYIWKFKSNAL